VTRDAGGEPIDAPEWTTALVTLHTELPTEHNDLHPAATTG
jgi:hypothetical protein